MLSTLWATGSPQAYLAAAGQMGLETRHAGVDGFTALQVGDSHGGRPVESLPHKGAPCFSLREL